MTGLPYLVRPRASGCAARGPASGAWTWPGAVEAVGADVTAVPARGRGVRHAATGAFAEYAARPAGPARRASRPTSPSSRPRRVPISGITALQALRDSGQVQAGQRGPRHRRGRRRRQRSPCSSPRRSAPRSPACAAPRRWTWSARSAPTTSSTTPATTSRRSPAIRPHPRHRRQPPAHRPAARAHAEGTLVIVGGEGGGRLTGGFHARWRRAALRVLRQRLTGSWLQSERGPPVPDRAHRGGRGDPGHRQELRPGGRAGGNPGPA